MHPLDDARRRLLAFSAVCCAVPLCLLPLAGRSSLEMAAERAAFDVRFTAPQLEQAPSRAHVDVARDPFVAEVPEQTRASRAAPAGGLVGIEQPAQVVVDATVVGDSARALVREGARARVVGIGDPLAGSFIVSIDRSGIKLANGSLLALSETGP